jgi:hypothetical protein
MRISELEYANSVLAARTAQLEDELAVARELLAANGIGYEASEQAMLANSSPR